MLLKRMAFYAAILAVVCISSGILAGCGQPADDSDSHSSKDLFSGKITIGTETWPGYFPLYLAQEKGFFKEAGLDVEVKQYVGLGELSRDYQAGKMQGRANITLDAVTESLNGFDHLVVLAIDYSNGSDAIVAKKEIGSVQDFRGKKVGFESGTLEEFFLAWALRENGLALSDVETVFGNPEETAKQLSQGSLDVAVSHEPFLSKFLESGEFHKVYSSADAPGLVMDVLTFRKDFVESYPETVGVISRAYFRALDWYRVHPQEALAILAKWFGDTPESLAHQLEGIRMLDLHDNKTAFTYAAGLRSVYGNMQEVRGFIQNHREMKGEVLDTDSLVDRRFIQKLSDAG